MNYWAYSSTGYELISLSWWHCEWTVTTVHPSASCYRHQAMPKKLRGWLDVSRPQRFLTDFAASCSSLFCFQGCTQISAPQRKKTMAARSVWYHGLWSWSNVQSSRGMTFSPTRAPGPRQLLLTCFLEVHVCKKTWPYSHVPMIPIYRSQYIPSYKTIVRRKQTGRSPA